MSATGQEPSAPTEAAPEATPEVTTTPAPDAGLDRIFSRMDEIAGQVNGIAGRVDAVQRLVEPPEEEPEFYEEDVSLTEDGARLLIQQMVDERVQAQMAPREAAWAVNQRDELYDQLRQTYPELQKDEVSGPVLQSAIRWANSVDPSIVEKPEFVEVIEWVYTHGKYAEHAEREAAEQPRPVVLESGQGARRQQLPSEPDWGDRIVKAAEQMRPQI